MQETWDGQFEEESLSLSDYIRILYRGRWIILLSFVVVVAATAYYTFTTPPTYEAECAVMVDQTGGLERTLFDAMPFSGKQLTMINNQVEILKSRRLAEQVVDRLFQSPVKDSLQLFVLKEKPEEPVDLRAVGIGRLRGNLEVTPVRDTDIIKIKMKAPTPWEAAFLANQMAEGYLALDRESSRGEMNEVVHFLEQQLAQKEQDLKQSEEQLRRFQQSSGVVALSTEMQKLVDQLVDFETAYRTAETELKTYETRLAYLKSQLGDRSKTLDQDLARITTPFIQELRQKIAEKEAELAVMKIKNMEDYPDGRKLRDEIEGLKKTLNEEIKKVVITNLSATQALSSLSLEDPLQPLQDLLTRIIEAETEVEANTARVQKLKEIVDQYSKQLENLPQTSLELARLERNRKLDENIYLMMKEKYEEARITRAGQIGKIRVVDNAVPPGSPVSPKVKLNLLLGVLIGLGLGVGITFFLEYIDTSLRTVKDVERLHLPLLGTIPEIQPEESNGFWTPAFLPTKKKRKRRHHSVNGEAAQIAGRLITHLKPKSPVSEAYRSLRTQIQYSKTETPPRTILVSSPGPAEGKSTSVTNLAIAMAQMGSKTLLVDSDLRRPVLHKLFSVKRDVGLSNYLVAGDPLGQIIKQTPIENLSLITTGILPPNPSEILGSRRMKAFIDEVANQFDYVFFDSPPLITVTDAVVLAPLMDGVVLVLRSGKTDRAAATRAQELLQNVEARLLGCLLNDVSSSSLYGSYYYYYYYYYYYGTEDGKKKKRKRRKKSKRRHAAVDDSTA